ncbi:MAG: translation initiation factor IF-2 [Anaerolineae bacterium]
MTKARKPVVEEEAKESAKKPDKAKAKPARAPEEDDLLGPELFGKRRLRILRDFEVEEEDEEDELLKLRAPARRKVRAPDEEAVEEKVLDRQPKPGVGKKPKPAPAPTARPAKREKRAETTSVQAPEKPAEKVLTLPASISVRDLASRMGISPIDVIKELMNNGVMANINQMIDFDTAAIVASELGFTPVEEKPAEPEVMEEKAPEKTKPLWRLICEREDPSKLKPRPPVVTVLGHVDHGKTTLLDAIRHANVAASEAGGITQRIGAYQVDVHGKKITFIDTPGHEAFTAMRARGAQVTDLAVLVVAADDGVMPQTREAINHARAAQVPILVALNKIDKANANPERVKQQLADEGLVVEDWGGDVICVPISAKLGQGIDELLENILLVTEVAELKANPDCPAMGTVLESKIDKARGPIATLLVQNGTLRVGDNVVVGEVYGRVRAMFDDRGNLVKEAPPSMPVAVLGLSGLPAPGDMFEVVASEREAKTIAEERARQREAAAAKAARRVLTLEDIASRIKAGQAKELNIILKADVQGAIEPIVKSLERLGDEELRVKILHTGTGNISESDVMLAAASDAIVVGFGVQVDQAARRLAEQEGVDIRLYTVIYMLLEDMEKALKGMLEPKFEEKVLGHAEVRAVFRVSKLGQVAGCYVMDGVVSRDAQVRVHRGDAVVFDGRVASLKRFTEDGK